MKSITREAHVILIVLAWIFAFVLCGCEGTDARKSVTGTVEDLVGKKAIEKGEQMKEDIDRAVEDEVRRLLKMDGGDRGDPSQEPHEE